jgi:anti-anti-sigma factor
VEISLDKKGDLQILRVKGKIHLQNWRVLDKHLENLLAKGCRWLAMDLSAVTLICSTGIGSILHNVSRFRDGRGALMLVCTAGGYMRETLRTFGCDALDETYFTDWTSLESRLRSQGAAIPS